MTTVDQGQDDPSRSRAGDQQARMLVDGTLGLVAALRHGHVQEAQALMPAAPAAP